MNCISEKVYEMTLQVFKIYDFKNEGYLVLTVFKQKHFFIEFLQPETLENKFI